MRRFFYWPGDVIAAHTCARDRRAAAAWLFIAFAVAFCFWPNAVWLVSLMSIAALLGTVAAETPVEDEASGADA